MELRDRLRNALGDQQPRRSPASDRRQLAGLRREETSHGPLFFMEERWPLTHRHGDYRLGEALNLAPEAMARLLPGSGDGSLRDAVFLDIETTGLSGGTGTLVFLIGAGAFESDGFVLRQYFLADIGYEVAMLAPVAAMLDGRRTIVSFNGRRFDLPLIQTRLTLARLQMPELDNHLDLLYPSRRLYKSRLPSCSLAAIEAGALRFWRDGDVPGALAPAIYLDYVRTGRGDDLLGVFEHNALDILSLVSLAAHLGQLCAGHGDADDCLALGHWDESARRFNRAAATFRDALARAETGEQRSAARLRLARLYKRAGEFDAALPLWKEEADSGTTLARLEALTELAKISEHHHRDLQAAESHTRRALELHRNGGAPATAAALRQLARPALEHRLRRLVRRRANRQA